MRVKPAEHFEKPELEKLLKRSNGTFGLKTALWACWLVAAWAGTGSAQASFRILAIVLLGLAIAHGAELCHQALHFSGFTSKAANVVTGYAFGLPLLISFKDYRRNHLRHHCTVGTAKDSEFFDYGKNGLDAKELFVNLLMLRHYQRYMARCYEELARPFARSAESAGTPRDAFYPLSLAGLLLTGFALSATGHAVYFWSYLFALFFVAGPVHYLIELPEHFACDSRSLSVFQNTRTIQTNRLMCWFVNGNNYHVEHHLLGNAPLQSATQVHARIAGSIVYLETGYLSFYRKAFTGVFAREAAELPSDT